MPGCAVHGASPNRPCLFRPGFVCTSLTLSAIDTINLKTLLIALTGEQIVLGLSLWVLFRVTRPHPELLKETGGTETS
jgi:hypothetical protein